MVGVFLVNTAVVLLVLSLVSSCGGDSTTTSSISRQSATELAAVTDGISATESPAEHGSGGNPMTDTSDSGTASTNDEAEDVIPDIDSETNELIDSTSHIPETEIDENALGDLEVTSVHGTNPNATGELTQPVVENTKEPTPVTLTADLDKDGIPDNEDDDVDGDGILNIEDPDDDNDGVEDYYDELKYDPEGSDDFDRDSIEDDADTDNDNDGVSDANDRAPKNQLCSRETDINASGVCLIDVIKDQLPKAAVSNSLVAYIPDQKSIYPLDLETKSFLSPIDSFDGSDITVLRNDSASAQVFVGYSSGLVTYIDSNHEQKIFVELDGRIGAIITTPDWIVTNTYPYGYPATSVFDKNGQYLHGWSLGNGNETNKTLWIDSTQSLVWIDRTTDYWNTSLKSRSINLEDLPTTHSVSLGQTFRSTLFTVKSDGSIVVTGDGGLFNGASLENTGSLPADENRITITGVDWSDNHGLVMQSSYRVDNGYPSWYLPRYYFMLEQWDDDYNSDNKRIIEGHPRAFFGKESNFYFVYERDSVMWLDQYKVQ